MDPVILYIERTVGHRVSLRILPVYHIALDGITYRPYHSQRTADQPVTIMQYHVKAQVSAISLFVFRVCLRAAQLYDFSLLPWRSIRRLVLVFALRPRTGPAIDEVLHVLLELFYIVHVCT